MRSQSRTPGRDVRNGHVACALPAHGYVAATNGPDSHGGSSPVARAVRCPTKAVTPPMMHQGYKPRAAAVSTRRRTRKRRAENATPAVTTADGSADSLLVSRANLLTPQEEIDCARDIEDGEQRVLDAVARSPVALRELVALGEQVAQDEALPADLVHTTAGDERQIGVLVRAITDAARALECALTEPGGQGKVRAAHDDFTRAILPHRLGQPALERILRALEAASESDLTIATSIRCGRQQARRATTKLVEANMRLVHWLARRKASHSQGVALNDLIQEGSLGLMRAADRFDHRHRVRFSTYAAWWIRHHMNRALADSSRMIRLPVHFFEKRHQVVRAAEQFRLQHGRQPTDEELSEQTSATVERVREILSAPSAPLSLDAPFGADNDGTLSERVGDERNPSPLDDIAVKQAGEQLETWLACLTPREREILRLRFGEGRTDPMTFEHIGRRFALSRERVRQIEAEALKKLRRRAEAAEVRSGDDR